MRLVSSILIAGFCYMKTAPTVARIENGLHGTGRLTLNQTVKYMERMAGEKFLHSAYPDMIIRVTYGEVPKINRPGAKVLGVAMPGIVVCDIVLNPEVDPDGPNYRGTTDLPLILMHEIGHCFGMSHDHDDPESIMYPESLPRVQRSSYSVFKFFYDLKVARGDLSLGFF